ncbi:MAG: hypothetical protein V3S24_02210 [Candidatus Tectomicrobia bacterium]
MKYATLLCLASILAVCFTACSLFSQPEDELSQQERLLVGPTWKLVAIFDTYDELWHEDDGTGSESIFEFYKDKRFMQDEVGGCCKQVGIWRFAEDERELTLRYTDGSNRDLSYEVRELSAGELELAWLGRHGPVIERYRPK